MTGPREPKKTETLEVRLPHKVKGVLMDKARAEGRTASEVIRESIDCYLAEQTKKPRPMIFSLLWKPLAAAGAAASAIVWSGLATAPAGAMPDLSLAFETFDSNRDRVISLDEFLQHRIDPATAKKIHGAAPGHGSHAMHGGAKHSKPSEQDLREHFGEMDADSNGTVTLEELRGFHDRMAAAHHKS